MLRDIHHGETDGGEVGLSRRHCFQFNFGPVSDEGHFLKSLLECFAGNVRVAFLMNSISTLSIRSQIVAIAILKGRYIVQRNHLPVTGFLFSQQGGKNLIVLAERNAGGTVPNKMDATGRVGQRDGNRVCKDRYYFDMLTAMSIFIVILIGSLTLKRGRLILFQIPGTAENGDMHGLQLRSFSQSFRSQLVSGNGESNLHLTLRLHKQILLPFTGTRQGREHSRCYNNPLSHRILSPQVKISGIPVSLFITRSSPQYQLSYTQRT